MARTNPKRLPNPLAHVPQVNLIKQNGDTINAASSRKLTPILLSTHAPWKDMLRLEEHMSTQGESASIFKNEHMIGVRVATSAGMEEWRIDGEKPKKINYMPGQMTIVPADTPFTHRVWAQNHLLVVFIKAAFMARIANQSPEAGPVALSSRTHVVDEQIKNLILSLRAELKAGCLSGKLFGESVATALCAHLLKCSSDPSVNMREPKGTLSVKRLKRILEYIQDNLGEDLSLTDLARLADMSPYHFARLFKQSTGLPPHRYILNQRIERAKLFLEDPHYSSLADISYQLGFSSQSHFTKAFRNFTGTTPAYYRKYSA